MQTSSKNILFESATHQFCVKPLTWSHHALPQAHSPVGLFELKPAMIDQNKGWVPLLNNEAFPILFGEETDAQHAAQTAQWMMTQNPIAFENWTPNTLGGHSHNILGNTWETVQGHNLKKGWFVTVNAQPAPLFFANQQYGADTCQQYLTHLLLELLEILPKAHVATR